LAIHVYVWQLNTLAWNSL